MYHWRTFFKVFGLLPLLYCVALLSFYFHAAIVLGKFPMYGQPDPKELSFYWVYAPVIIFTGSIWLYSIILGLITTLVNLVINRKKISWKPIILSALCHIGAVALFLSWILEWFAD